jgi:hypothetical protein
MFGTIQRSSERPTAAPRLSARHSGRHRASRAAYTDSNAILKTYTFFAAPNPKRRPAARSSITPRLPGNGTRCSPKVYSILCFGRQSQSLSSYQYFGPHLPQARLQSTAERVWPITIAISQLLSMFGSSAAGAGKNSRVGGRDFSAFINVLAPAPNGAAKTSPSRRSQFSAFCQCFGSSATRTCARTARVGTAESEVAISQLLSMFWPQPPTARPRTAESKVAILSFYQCFRPARPASLSVPLRQIV